MLVNPEIIKFAVNHLHEVGQAEINFATPLWEEDRDRLNAIYHKYGLTGKPKEDGTLTVEVKTGAEVDRLLAFFQDVKAAEDEVITIIKDEEARAKASAETWNKTLDQAMKKVLKLSEVK
jgi:hypothetical protein